MIIPQTTQKVIDKTMMTAHCRDMRPSYPILLVVLCCALNLGEVCAFRVVGQNLILTILAIGQAREPSLEYPRALVIRKVVQFPNEAMPPAYSAHAYINYLTRKDRAHLLIDSWKCGHRWAINYV